MSDNEELSSHRFRKVEMRMWADARFRGLSAAGPNSQTLVIYLLTGRYSLSIPGVSAAKIEDLATELNWPVGKRKLLSSDECSPPSGEGHSGGLKQADLTSVKRKSLVFCIRELISAGLIEFDEAGLVCINGAFRGFRVTKTTVFKSWATHWALIPECPLKEKLLVRLDTWAESLTAKKKEAYQNLFRSLAEPYFSTVPAEKRSRRPYKEKEKEKYKQMERGALAVDGSVHVDTQVATRDRRSRESAASKKNDPSASGVPALSPEDPPELEPPQDLARTDWDAMDLSWHLVRSIRRHSPNWFRQRDVSELKQAVREWSQSIECLLVEGVAPDEVAAAIEFAHSPLGESWHSVRSGKQLRAKFGEIYDAAEVAHLEAQESGAA